MLFNDITDECVSKSQLFYNFNNAAYNQKFKLKKNSDSYETSQPFDLYFKKVPATGKIYDIKPSIIYENLLESGKVGQILTANQMSINVIYQKALRSALQMLVSSLQNEHIMRLVGDECEVDRQCINYAKCVRFLCQCTDNYLERNSVCIKKNVKKKFKSKTSDSIKATKKQTSINKNNLSHSPTKNINQSELEFSDYSNRKNSNNLQLNYNHCHRCPQNLTSDIKQISGQNVPILIKRQKNIQFIESKEKSDFFSTKQPEFFTTTSQQAGADCSKPTYACGWNSYCNTINGICECSKDMDTYKGACVLARRLYGNECILTANCDQHNYCDNGYCICRAEFKMTNGYSLPSGKFINDESNIYNNIMNSNLINKRFPFPNVFTLENFKIYYPDALQHQIKKKFPQGFF